MTENNKCKCGHSKITHEKGAQPLFRRLWCKRISCDCKYFIPSNSQNAVAGVQNVGSTGGEQLNSAQKEITSPVPYTPLTDKHVGQLPSTSGDEFKIVSYPVLISALNGVVTDIKKEKYLTRGEVLKIINKWFQIGEK